MASRDWTPPRMLELLWIGVETAVTPTNILAVFAGCLIGTAIGAFPGLSAPTAIALLLPVTFAFEPSTSIIMLAGIYYGSQYGNSITAVLLGIPGDSAAVVTAMEGHELAKVGRAGHALTVAAVASFTAGIVGVVIFATLGPALAWVGLRFGDAEYVALILLAFCTLPAFARVGKARVVVGVVIGLLLTTVGLDFATGTARFTFGEPSLLEGIPLIPAIIGLFGISEALHIAGSGRKSEVAAADARRHLAVGYRDLLPPIADWLRLRLTLLRTSVLGFLIGVLPGAGATIASFSGYAVERGVAKDKPSFGKGDLRGLAAGEAGNSGASIGAMLPMLCLGIPGSGATAVMLGGFLIWGVEPGPTLFDRQPVLVWGLIVSMLIGNFMLLAMSVLLVPFFTRLMVIPHAALAALIIVFCTAGTYATNNSVADVYIMFGCGLLGYLFRTLEIPIAPVVLAVVLGGKLEEHLRRSLLVYEDGLWALIDRPISLGLLIAAACLILLPLAARWRRSRTDLARRKQPPEEDRQ